MKEVSPLVSVIIPTYNAEKFISRTIKSVLSQTYKYLELIVIDDGSTDNTKKIIEDFLKKDVRIKYYWQNNSGGAANPKNNAINFCSGKYIAYLDHDDEWLEDKLAEQIKLIESEPNIGLVACHSRIIQKDRERVHKVSQLRNFEDFLNNPANYIFSNSSIIMPIEVIKRVGERDENLKLFEDFDYFVRVINNGYKIKFVDKALLKYYYHDTNLSKDKKRIIDFKLFLIKHENSFLKQSNYTQANYYRRLGTTELLTGQKIKSINYFFKAIKRNPDLKNISTFLASLLLTKRLYELILNLKIRLAIQ